MSLFDTLPLGQLNTPQRISAPKTGVFDAKPYAVTIKRASNGDEILLCNVTPPTPAAIEKAKSMNMALFTTFEITAMRQASADDPDYINKLIHARRIFGWGGPISFHQEAV